MRFMLAKESFTPNIAAGRSTIDSRAKGVPAMTRKFAKLIPTLIDGQMSLRSGSGIFSPEKFSIH